MRKVALLMQSFEEGGVQRLMINLANGFVSDGYAIDMLVSDDRGVMKKSVSQEVNTHGFRKTRYKGDFKVLFSLVRLVKYIHTQRPDILIAAPGFAGAVAITARFFARKTTKIIVIIDNKPTLMLSLGLKHKISYYLYKTLYRYADEIVVAHRSATKDLLANFKVDKKKVHTIYHPLIKPDDIESKNTDIDLPDHRTHKNDRLILSAGRLVKEKDFVNLVEAFNIVHKKEKNTRLIILGAGPEQASIERVIKEHGLEASTLLYGHTDNPIPFMRAADLFVLSSRQEAFGNVVVEALACGTMVVATDCESGGPREILGSNKYGYLCPIEDSESLAKTILLALNNPILKETSLMRGMQFSVQSSVKQYEKLFVADGSR